MERGRTPSASWLALPLFLAYPLWAVFDGLSSQTAPLALGLVLVAFPLLATLVRRGEGLSWLAPPVAILLGCLVGLLGSIGVLSSPDAGLAILSGILVGFPLVVAAALLRTDLDFGTPWIVIVGGVFECLVVQAALVRLAAEGVSPVADAFAISCGQVVHLQVAGLGTILSGGLPGALPLQALPSPEFAVFLLLALVGGFLTFFAPSGDASVSASARAISDSALPFLVGVLGAAGFELLAARSPTYALLGLAVGTILAVVAIVLLASPRARRAARSRMPGPAAAGAPANRPGA
jgi:hypothetical protein